MVLTQAVRFSLFVWLTVVWLTTDLGVSGSVILAQDPPTLALPESDEGLPGAGPIRRYDWFKSLWNERRSAWAKSVEQDQKAVVFLGDSITQGLGDDVGKLFPGVKFANRGISGDTTRGMLIRLEQDVVKLNPACVVMLMGTNDLEEKADPSVIASNVRLIVEQLKKHNAEMPIVLCQVFPSSASKNRPADKIKEINRLSAEAVLGDAQITVLDTWSLFANDQGDAKPEEMPDLLHPNGIGYARWAAALRPVMATLGLLETDADPFEPEPGFESLFNGKDLTGWGYFVNRKQSREFTRFDGQRLSSEGRYLAQNGRLTVTTPPEGRKIQQLYTTREFPGNFTLKLEFRATPNADSGVFIREPQLQCRDYPLAGPYKELKSFKSLDWNDMVVVVKDGVAHCTCNGEVLEAALKVPETGPIGLEGDRGQMEYRRIRIRSDSK